MSPEWRHVGPAKFKKGINQHKGDRKGSDQCPTVILTIPDGRRSLDCKILQEQSPPQQEAQTAARSVSLDADKTVKPNSNHRNQPTNHNLTTKEDISSYLDKLFPRLLKVPGVSYRFSCIKTKKNVPTWVFICTKRYKGLKWVLFPLFGYVGINTIFIRL